MLSIGTLDIESLVRTILADLSDKEVSPSAPVVSVPIIPDPVADSDSVYIDSRVLSLADLKNKLGTAKKLFISPKCILTPSARDELRKQQIEIAVRLNSTTNNRSGCWLALHRPITISTILADRFRKEFDLTQETFDTLPELVDAANRQLQTKRIGVALTKQVATVLRLANRQDAVRAVLGIDPKQTSEDAAEIDANLLVIQPNRVGEFRIWDIVQQFTKRAS